jgi:drug/metabolite transporter (DMT)-like permease
VLEFIPPFVLITLRLVLGILVLWAILRRHGGTGLTHRQTKQAVGVGFVGYGVSLGFQFVGTKLSTASNGALVTSATPAFVLLFAAWLLRERITMRRLLALSLSMLGVLAVIDPRNASLSPISSWKPKPGCTALTDAIFCAVVRKVTLNLDIYLLRDLLLGRVIRLDSHGARNC